LTSPRQAATCRGDGETLDAKRLKIVGTGAF